MIYGGIAVGVGLVAIVLLYVSFKLLKGSWLLGWLRGTLGLSALAAASMIALLAWDLSTYSSVSGDGAVATISFTKLGEQQYRATVVAVNGGEFLVDLEGELWRVDLRSFYWDDALGALGLEPGYRLSGMLGRYLSLEQEQQSIRAVQPLMTSRYDVDSWRLFELMGGEGATVAAVLEESPYLPMVDNAIYRIEVSSGKLNVVAVNEPAQNAMVVWQ